MFDSIWEDAKREYRMGNMVTRIIMICVSVFFAVALLDVIAKGIPDTGISTYRTFIEYLSMPGSGWQLLKQPWSLVTHMFLHEGFWHMLWNMVWLYMFGRIMGDLLGDRRVLPLYLLSGFSGAMVFFFYAMIFTSGGGYALGASAAVSGIIMAAAVTAPDYMIRLVLLGNIPIKYIAAFKILLDILSLGADNTGGSVAHLGGIAFGWFFVFQLRKGVDLTEPMQNWIFTIKNWFSNDGKKTKQQSKRKEQSRKSMKVVHQQERKSSRRVKSAPEDDMQLKMDRILDKINEKGMSGLTDEERDFLNSFGN